VGTVRSLCSTPAAACKVSCRFRVPRRTKYDNLRPRIKNTERMSVKKDKILSPKGTSPQPGASRQTLAASDRCIAFSRVVAAFRYRPRYRPRNPSNCQHVVEDGGWTLLSATTRNRCRLAFWREDRSSAATPVSHPLVRLGVTDFRSLFVNLLTSPEDVTVFGLYQLFPGRSVARGHERGRPGWNRCLIVKTDARRHTDPGENRMQFDRGTPQNEAVVMQSSGEIGVAFGATDAAGGGVPEAVPWSSLIFLQRHRLHRDPASRLDRFSVGTKRSPAGRGVRRDSGAFSAARIRQSRAKTISGFFFRDERAATGNTRPRARTSARPSLRSPIEFLARDFRILEWRFHPILKNLACAQGIDYWRADRETRGGSPRLVATFVDTQEWHVTVGNVVVVAPSERFLEKRHAHLSVIASGCGRT